MAQIPFYANRSDNESCMLACLRSALEYLQGRQYSWEELGSLTGFQPSRVAWTIKTWEYLARHGFEIRMIEGFDYQRYFEEGESYLSQFLRPEELEYQLEHSNILEIKPLIPAFLKSVQYTKRSPSLTDIDTMLQDGFLVTAQLNSKILNEEHGYLAHMILIFDKEGDNYTAHDPGLPAFEARHILSGLLYKAMGGENNTVEITGLKLQTQIVNHGEGAHE